MITTVDTHTAGEPTRVVTGGIPHVPGRTMTERKQWLQNNLDQLRRTLMWEPRGHQDMFGAVITSPVCEEAEVGVIFMDSDGYLDMCGHGSIGAVTVLLNTGMLSVPDQNGPVTRQVVLDTPAGLVIAKAQLKDGKVHAVTIRNVAAFLYDTLQIDMPSLGAVPVNIAYGGNFFALVKSSDLGIPLAMDRIKELQSVGVILRHHVNREIDISHPGSGRKARVDLVEIYEDGDVARNVVIFGAGQVDRSPCGTGTCAKMAMLYEQNRLAIDEQYLYQSLFGTTFTGRIVEETAVGAKRAVIPEITGRAYITGIHQFVIDPDDPLRSGFLLEQDETGEEYA